jgi:hypothetical protein
MCPGLPLVPMTTCKPINVDMLELEEEFTLLELLDVELELDDEVTLEFDEELMLELVVELETVEEDEAFESEL